MKKPAAKAKTTTKMAPRMPNGTEMMDIAKGSWKLGDAIGSGGFGLIYLTQKCPHSGPVTSKAEHVMKLERYDSGPLFCEQAFFQRATKQDNVKAFKSSRGLKCLGLPNLIAMGNPTYNGEKLRFLVIPRFNTDLQKLFENSGKKFPPGTVFRVALQVLDVLEYIHSQGYAHADIKAANLMLGNKDPNQVYLIDYGLAFRFNVEGKHKEYKEDPKKAHDGTTEYASRDAHKGVWPSARGDLETLGYCMWQWLAGKLPWEKDINNKPLVADCKTKYMGSIDSQVAPLIKDQASSKGLCKFLTAVNELGYDESPKYDDIRQIFRSTLASLKCRLSDKLDFSSSPSDAGLISPVRRSGRSSKVQTAIKPRQSNSALLKSPIPKAKTQRPVEAKDLKSPARATGRERMFSPSPSPRSKVTKAKDDVLNNKATKKVVSAVTSTNHNAGIANGNSRKRKQAEPAGNSSPKKKKTVAAATERAPVPSRSPSARGPSRSPSARATQLPTKLSRKKLTAVNELGYDESPKYDDIRPIFHSTLASLKCKLSDKLGFSSSPSDAGLLSPVRRSGRSSKVQTAIKPRQSISASPKSPIPKAKTQRPVEAKDMKSPARATGRERMFSPSSPPRSKVAKAKDDVLNNKATKKVVSAVKSTNHDAGIANGNSRKRKQDELGGDSSPKKKKTVAAATERAPVPSRSPSARATNLPTNLRRKKLTAVRVSSSTQTTPGLRTRSRTQGGL